jgi:ABC-2 type transport system permease protein
VSGTAPESSARVVAPAAATGLVYRLLVRQLVTWGRLVALLAVAAGVVAIALVLGVSDEIDDRLEAGVELISNIGFTTLVPVVALVFASASLGDARDDGTLVYLWLRPMDRWPVVVGAWSAAVTVSLPLTVVPLAVSAAVTGGGGSLVGATVLATAVGVVTYAAVFVLLGLLVRNSVVWGLGYVLVWEGVVAAFGNLPARLSIRGYTRSVLTSMTDVDLDLGDLPLAAGVVVPLLMSGAALAAAAVRLRSMDVA